MKCEVCLVDLEDEAAENAHLIEGLTRNMTPEVAQVFERFAGTIHGHPDFDPVDACELPEPTTMAATPYWHQFRVHLDWVGDGEDPENWSLVWHRKIWLAPMLHGGFVVAAVAP